VNDEVKRLYQETLVAHGKAPANQGPLPEATHQAELANPLCGDEVTVRAVVEDGRLAAVRFEARGCLLSRAAASLMTEAVAGAAVPDALARGQALAAMLRGVGAPETLGPLAVFAGVREFPSRAACVNLPWQALARALASST
jgi:nitrogen fixation NifU-like protein